jgi:hypothetical protein
MFKLLVMFFAHVYDNKVQNRGVAIRSMYLHKFAA